MKGYTWEAFVSLTTIFKKLEDTQDGKRTGQLKIYPKLQEKRQKIRQGNFVALETIEQ